ncbi:MAG: hypothetical protein DME84_04805 [Verrucomicrobia bacterium]|nr:MAG: hypothetical protein DME84_04805 [Verrucomicrobiota bacterium]
MFAGAVPAFQAWLASKRQVWRPEADNGATGRKLPCPIQFVCERSDHEKVETLSRRNSEFFQEACGKFALVRCFLAKDVAYTSGHAKRDAAPSAVIFDAA